jgi:hypothetical protein
MIGFPITRDDGDCSRWLLDFALKQNPTPNK